MFEWQTIESVLFRGGPRDGDRLRDVTASQILDVLEFTEDDRSTSSYAKTRDCEQLRGVDVDVPYSRAWYYDWVQAQ